MVLQVQQKLQFKAQLAALSPRLPLPKPNRPQQPKSATSTWAAISYKAVERRWLAAWPATRAGRQRRGGRRRFGCLCRKTHLDFGGRVLGWLGFPHGVCSGRARGL